MQNPKTGQQSDPFISNKNVYKRLVSEHKKHAGQLIVALDYDNTIYDYHSKGYTFGKLTRLIQDCNKVGYKIVIFSGSAQERHLEIREFCNTIGIKVDGINTNLIDWHPDKALNWSTSKIYYNILLDDRAGLKSAYKVLRKLVSKVQKNEL